MKLYLAERLQAARELGGEGLIAIMRIPSLPAVFDRQQTAATSKTLHRCDAASGRQEAG
jgi:hypothetical protein